MDELRAGLELATEEELQDLTQLLFRRQLNPLDYLQGITPETVQCCNRQAWLEAIEQRFKFLAADGFTVLKGQTRFITYRQVLVRICGYLKLRLSPNLSTTELESEIFLHLVQRTWHKLPKSERQVLSQRIHKALVTASTDPLPLSCHQDPLRLVLEGGSALVVSSMVRPLLLRQIARQFTAHFATYQVTKRVASNLPFYLQGQMMLHTARQGMTFSVARYGAMRSVLAVMGSMLWVGFLADLGWRTIATNYGRVIPMVFTLAQIRLIRSEWQPA